jgi:hypothetical protein
VAAKQLPTAPLHLVFQLLLMASFSGFWFGYLGWVQMAESP